MSNFLRVVLGLLASACILYFNIMDDFKVTDTLETPLQSIVPQNLTTGEITLETVTLDRVVDGDTIIVRTSSNEEVRVRLIGIDTPESVHPNSDKNNESGVAASEYTKSLLKDGQPLYLEYDKEKLDPYDRTLAYVWLEKVDTFNNETLHKSMLNAKLVHDGYAEPKHYQPNVKYKQYFDSYNK